MIHQGLDFVGEFGRGQIPDQKFLGKFVEAPLVGALFFVGASPLGRGRHKTISVNLS